MSAILDLLSWAALLGGGFFCMVGAIGLNRMPDIFTRMHATSVSDTMGVGLLTAGMLMQTSDWTVIVRLIVILVILYTTGAVASHALARAALHDGEKPLLVQADGSLKPTDCADIYPELAVRLATPLVSEQVQDNEVPLTLPKDDEALLAEQKGDAPSNS